MRLHAGIRRVVVPVRVVEPVVVERQLVDETEVELLSLALKNNGIYTPKRVMLCISSPMTANQIQKAIEAFDTALEQLRPMIKRHCPQLLG